jgi:hypothetical protein
MLSSENIRIYCSLFSLVSNRRIDLKSSFFAPLNVHAPQISSINDETAKARLLIMPTFIR